MFFIIFTSLIASEEGIYHIRRSRHHLFLSSFGFRSNSNFTFKIYSSSLTKLNIFLLTEREFQSLSLKYIYKTCNDTYFKIAKLNKTFYRPNNFFSWEDNIDIRSVYYPVILICSNDRANLEIHYKYSNSISLIDFRNDDNSKVFLIFSFLNLFLGILWLLNSFINPKFSIPLHQIFAFIPLLKAISNSMIAFEWEKRKYNDKLPYYEKFITILFSISFYVIFMYSTSLAFSGWCVFRKIEIRWIEKVELFVSSLFIVFGMKLEDNYGTGFIGTVLKISGLFWYMKMNVNYLVISFSMSESDFYTDKMKLKVKLVQNFNFSFIIAFLFISLVKFCAVYVGAFDVMCDSITEIGILILEAVVASFFFLCDEVGDMDCDDDYIPLFLIEPHRSQFVFVNFNERHQNNSD